MTGEFPHVQTATRRHLFPRCFQLPSGITCLLRKSPFRQEINAIGRTFTYLIDLMSRFSNGDDGINPLHRLLPLVESSTFKASHRFTLNEPEFVLKPD